MISSVRLLSLSWLRQRPLRTLLTVVAVAAGVTLPVAVLVAQASVFDALAGFDEQRSGPAELEVVGGSQPGGVDEATSSRVADVDGVEAAVPMVQAVTFAEDGEGTETLVVALGVDCRIETIVGEVGCAGAGVAGELPAAGDAPFVSPTMQELLGQDGVLRTDGGRVATGDAPVLDLLDGINNGRIAVFSLPVAQELFSRHGGVDSVLVVPEPGIDLEDLRERVADAAGDQNRVRTTIGATEWIDPQVPLLFLVSLMALGVGGQLAHNAVALALEERRKDLAVTGALGASRRMLLAGTLVEAALLGLAGGALGVLGGLLVANPLVDQLGDSAAQLTGVGVALTIPPWVVVAGLLVGLAVTLLATIRPAWRAASADISADLQSRAVIAAGPETRAGVRALVLLGLAGACAVLAWLGQRDGAIRPWQPIAAQIGFVGVTILLARASYNAAAPMLRAVAGWVPRLRRGMAGVAVDNLSGNPRRTGTLTVAVGAAVSLGVVLGSIHQALPAGLSAEMDRDAPGAVQVSSLPALLNLGLAARPEPEIRDRIAELDGVAAVAGEYLLTIDHPDLSSEQVAVVARDGPPTSDFRVYRGDGPTDVLDRGDVLIGAALARDLGVGVGDVFQVPSRTGLADLRVGAIWANGWLSGRNISVPYERFEQLWGRHATFDLLVTPEPGTPVEALATRIGDELGGRYPDLEIRTSDVRADVIADDVSDQMDPFVGLQRGLLVVALIATLSTLLLAAIQRRREFGVLSAVGLAPEGISRMVLVEAGLVGVIGTVVGTLGGIASGVVLTFVVPVIFGYGSNWTYQVDLLAPLAYGALATACVLLGAALPAWRAARLDPTTALRYE
ncbi:MAG: ABC transporter permease [Acidimicrobiales bacterium]